MPRAFLSRDCRLFRPLEFMSVFNRLGALPAPALLTLVCLFAVTADDVCNTAQDMPSLSDDDGNTYHTVAALADRVPYSVRSFLLPAASCISAKMVALAAVVVRCILEYIAMPWLLVGAFVDVPLQLAIYYMYSRELPFLMNLSGGSMQSILWWILESCILLILRAFVVQLLAPMISKVLTAALSKKCYPLVKLVCLEPRPLVGSLTISLELDPDIIRRMAGLEHTTLHMHTISLDAVIWLTPLCPVWKAGCHIKRLQVHGGTYQTCNSRFDDCRYIYPKSSQQHQVAFERLPTAWTCPDCGAPKHLFVKCSTANDAVDARGCQWAHIKKRECAQKFCVEVEMDAVVHPWAGAVAIAPALPSMPAAPAAAQIVFPTVQLRLKTAGGADSVEQVKQAETLLLSVAPISVLILSVGELLKPVQLPFVKSVQVELHVKNCFCKFRQGLAAYMKSDEELEAMDLNDLKTELSTLQAYQRSFSNRDPNEFWVRAHLKPRSRFQSDDGAEEIRTRLRRARRASRAREQQSLPADVAWVDPNAGTETSGRSPLFKLDVAIVHARSVVIEAIASKLWLRTHFRALRMLVMALVPHRDASFPMDHMEQVPARHYVQTHRAEIDLRLRRLIDDLYAKHGAITYAILEQALLSRDRTLKDKPLKKLFGLRADHGFVDACTAFETLHKNVSGSNGQLESSTSLYLAFKCLRSRVDEALEELLNADAEVASDLVADMLEHNGFLRFLIDCSDVVDSKDLGKWTGWFQASGVSWCDYTIRLLRAEAGTLSRQDVWTLLCRNPTRPPEPEVDFAVEIRQYAEGLQELVQCYAGGPTLATVRANSSDSLKDLKRRVAEAIGVYLEDFELCTLGTGETLDQYSKTLAQVPERGYGCPFPNCLGVVWQLSHHIDWRFIKCKIAESATVNVSISMSIGLPTLVLSDRGIAESGCNTTGELVLNLGHAKVSCESHADSQQNRTKLILNQWNDSIAEKEHVGYDILRVQIYGHQLYVCRTLEQLLAEMYPDGIMKLNIEELHHILRQHVTFSTEDGAMSVDEVAAALQASARNPKEFKIAKYPKIANAISRSYILMNDDQTVATAGAVPGIQSNALLAVELGLCRLPLSMLRRQVWSGYPKFRARVELADLSLKFHLSDLVLITDLVHQMQRGADVLQQLLSQRQSDRRKTSATRTSSHNADEDVWIDDSDSERNCPKSTSGFEMQLSSLGKASTTDGRPSAVSITVDVLRSQISIISLTTQVRLDALRKTRGVGRMMGELRAFASRENKDCGAWEPLLEPWTCSILYEDGDLGDHGNPYRRIEVVAPELMVLNITYSLLKNVIELKEWMLLVGHHNSLSRSVKKRTRKVVKFPYYIKNDTGMDIEFAIGRDKRDFESVRQMVPSGQEAVLSTEQMRSPTMTAPACDYLPPSAFIWLPAGSINQPYRIENVRMVGVSRVVRDGLFKARGEHGTVLARVQVDGSGRKVVTVESTIHIDNRTDADLEVRLYKSRNSFIVHRYTAASVPVNILCNNDSDAIEVRPVKRSHFPFSEQLPTKNPLPKHVLPQLRPLTVCNQTADAKFHCHVGWRTDSDIECVVMFLPFMVLHNEIPHAIRLELNDGCTLADRAGDEDNQLEAGQSCAVSCFGNWPNSASLSLAVTAVDLLSTTALKFLKEAYAQICGLNQGTVDIIQRRWHEVDGLDDLFKHVAGDAADSTVDATDILSTITEDDKVSEKDFIFIFRFRNVEGQKEDMRRKAVMVYHEGALQRSRQSEDDKVHKENMQMRDERQHNCLSGAYKPAESWNAEPFRIPLPRNAFPGAAAHQLFMRYDFSLSDDVAMKLSLFSSHWIVNQTELPLQARVGCKKEEIAGLTLQPRFSHENSTLHSIQRYGYQLLGCGTSADMWMQLQVSGSADDAMDDDRDNHTVPIGVPMYLGSKLLKLKRHDEFIGADIWQQVRVKVRRAAWPFEQTNVVTIRPAWVLRNKSSVTIQVRVASGHYEMIGEDQDALTHNGKAISDGSPGQATIYKGTKFDAIGKVKKNKGFRGQTAVCFLHNGFYVWLPKMKDGKRILRRVDKAVLGWYKFTRHVDTYRKLGDYVPGKSVRKKVLGSAFMSHKFNDPPTGVIAVTRVQLSRKGEYCAKFQRPDGDAAWFDFAREDEATGELTLLEGIEEVFDREDQWRRGDRRVEIQPHSGSMATEQLGDSPTSIRTVPPGGVLPLECWESHASTQYLRVAILHQSSSSGHVWSTEFPLDSRSTDGSLTQKTFKLHDDRVLQAWIPQVGTVVIRDAGAAPFAVINATDQDMEYRVTPHECPRWTRLPKYSWSPIWGVLALSKSGKVGHTKPNGSRRDMRRFLPLINFPRLTVRSMNGGNTHDSYETAFEVDCVADIWSLEHQDLQVTVSRGQVKIASKLRKTTLLRPQLHTEFRMQGICCSFVTRQQNEWARLELDHLQMTYCSIGTLYVSVIQAEGFLQDDYFGWNDNYVKVMLAGEEWKTPTLTAENPVWKDEQRAARELEHKVFDCSMGARFTDTLVVELWDYDELSADDRLGSTRIGIDTQMSEDDFTDWYPTVDDLNNPSGRIQLRIKWEPDNNEHPDDHPVMMECNMGRCVFAPGVHEAHAQDTTTKATFAIDHGISIVQKWTHPDMRVVKALLIEISPTEGHPGVVEFNIFNSFVREAVDFAASLLDVAQKRTLSHRNGAQAALQQLVLQDDKFTEMEFTEGARIQCEAPGSLRMTAFSVHFGYDLDEFIRNLHTNKSASNVAKAFGIDLEDLLNRFAMSTAMTIASRASNDKQFAVECIELDLPKEGRYLTKIDLNNEVKQYLRRYLCVSYIGWHYLVDSILHPFKNKPQKFEHPERRFGLETGALQPYKSWATEWKPKQFAEIESIMLICMGRPMPQLVYHSIIARSDGDVMRTLPVIYDELWDSPKMILDRVKAVFRSTQLQQEEYSQQQVKVRSIAVMAGAERQARQSDHILTKTLAIGNILATGDRWKEFKGFWDGLTSMLFEDRGRIELFMCEGESDRRAFLLTSEQHHKLRKVAEDLQSLVQLKARTVTVDIVPRVAVVDRRALITAAAPRCDPHTFYLWYAGQVSVAFDTAKNLTVALNKSEGRGGILCIGWLGLQHQSKDSSKHHGCCSPSNHWKQVCWIGRGLYRFRVD